MEKIRQFLKSEQLLKVAKNQESFFTRDRVFTFQRLTLFIINLVRKTLQLEIIKFTDDLGVENVSKQAFSKARKKLNPKVFQLLNEKFISEFYTDNDILTFHGFRLLAIDGSKIQLPASDEIIKEYGCSKSQYGNEIPMAQASTLFDILNKITVHSIISPNNASERILAIRHLDILTEMQQYGDGRDKDLILLDRGYPSNALLAKFALDQRNFVMRCSKVFLTQFAPMLETNQKDVILTFKIFDSSRRKRVRDRVLKLLPAINRDIELKVRIVFFTLASGALEILVTSLLDDQKYTRELLFELYNLRWGTEENNKYLKSIAELENFSGKSKLSVEQDFYATVFTCNIANMLAQEALDEVNSVLTDKGLKYEYTINKNIALGLLKDDLIQVLLSGQELHIFCNRVKQKMAKYLIPIRKKRKFPRKKSPGRTYPANCRKSL